VAGVIFRLTVLALLGFAVSSCVGALVVDGATSLSLGSHAKGGLIRAAAMPFEGTGYLIHPDWRARGNRYGTEEMIGWLTGVFADANRSDASVVAYLGDLSARRGGSTTKHRSHASGRDVDIFLLASDTEGRVLSNLPGMLHFGSDGRACRWSSARQGGAIKESVPDARLDAKRNWGIVRAMLSRPGVEVQWIFLEEPLAALLIAEGEREGSQPELLAKARALFHQPTDSQPHDDHMHVRLFCSPRDRAFGCVDKKPKRWLKKHWKYIGDSGALAGQPR
jgi:penicillin-insensitive murein endopeptidase